MASDYISKSLIEDFDALLRMCRTLSESGCEDDFVRFAVAAEGQRQQVIELSVERDGAQAAAAAAIARAEDLAVRLEGAKRMLDVEATRRRASERRVQRLEDQLKRVREVVWRVGRSLPPEEQERLASFCSEGADGPESEVGAVVPAGQGVPPCETDTSPPPGASDGSSDLCTTGSLLSDIGYSFSEDDQLDDRRAVVARRGRAERREPKPLARRASTEIGERPEEKRYRFALPAARGDDGDVGGGGDGAGPSAAAGKGRLNRGMVDWGRGVTASPAGRRLEKGDGGSGEAGAVAGAEKMEKGPPAPTPTGTPTHTFCEKTVVKIESCSVCKKKFRFGKMIAKCSVCRAVCHEECRGSLHPCVPASEGKALGSAGKGDVAGTPEALPDAMLLPLLRRCTEVAESRVMASKGLYCGVTNSAEERELREALLRGEWGRLRGADPVAVAAALLALLRRRPEPLVTNALASDFVKLGEVGATAEERRARLEKMLPRLPAVNRAALAKLMLHLQRVAAGPSQPNADQLAKAMAPVVLGLPAVDKAHMLLRDMHKKVQAVLLMLETPSRVWEQFQISDEDLPAKMLVPSASPLKRRFSSQVRKIRGLKVKRPYFTPYN